MEKTVAKSCGESGSPPTPALEPKGTSSPKPTRTVKEGSAKEEPARTGGANAFLIGQS